MGIVIVIAGILSLALMGYLFFVLFRGEKL